MINSTGEPNGGSVLRDPHGHRGNWRSAKAAGERVPERDVLRRRASIEELGNRLFCATRLTDHWACAVARNPGRGGLSSP